MPNADSEGAHLSWKSTKPPEVSDFGLVSYSQEGLQVGKVGSALSFFANVAKSYQAEAGVSPLAHLRSSFYEVVIES